MKVLAITLAISIAISEALAATSLRTLSTKEHPGCLVWWFLPDCPLGKIFGADPFGIYPWEKFCERYTAFDETEFCKKTVKAEAAEEMEPKESHVELFDKEKTDISVERRPRVSARR